jgi:hypothetical protein
MSMQGVRETVYAGAEEVMNIRKRDGNRRKSCRFWKIVSSKKKKRE